jgi:acetoin utilization deacetylase AcuC-like enzyme
MSLLFTDEYFERHETGRHPESARRLQAVARHLDANRLIDRCVRGEIRRATREELERVHSSAHIDLVARFAREGGGFLDPDTIVSEESSDVAMMAAGTACAAVDAVLTGQERRALALVRPPGHHALADRAMGFCLFNNIAVAAAHARQVHGLNRVLVVDWDVHHGNGTQDIYYEDESVHFLSLHRYPFYPGTGAEGETGSGPGLGATRNVPLAFGISRKEYVAAFTSALEDTARNCRPELILLSAGFDAHAADPVGSLGLESEDFGELTDIIIDAANQYCGGRLVSLLEGGYNVEKLGESVSIHLESLLDADDAAPRD